MNGVNEDVQGGATWLLSGLITARAVEERARVARAMGTRFKDMLVLGLNERTGAKVP